MLSCSRELQPVIFQTQLLRWQLTASSPQYRQKIGRQWSGRFLGIIGGDPSVCKSNRLHVDILQFSFIRVGHFPWIRLKRSVVFPQLWTSTSYFSNSTGSLVSNCRFSPIDFFTRSSRHDILVIHLQHFISYPPFKKMQLKWHVMSCPHIMVHVCDVGRWLPWLNISYAIMHEPTFPRPQELQIPLNGSKNISIVPFSDSGLILSVINLWRWY